MGGSRSQGLWLQGPGGLRVVACPLVGEAGPGANYAGSWALWCKGWVLEWLWAQGILRQPRCWWVRPVSALISYREDSKIVLARISVTVVERDPQNDCHQCLYSQGELHLPSVSPGDSPRSASGSDPESFQITASFLGPGMYEILCGPFKSGVSISHSPLTLPKVRPDGFQSQTFWGLIFMVQNPQAGEPSVGLGSHAPCNYNYPPICGWPTWVYGSWLYCFSAPSTCLVVVPSLHL